MSSQTAAAAGLVRSIRQPMEIQGSMVMMMIMVRRESPVVQLASHAAVHALNRLVPPAY
jgi:hypothetical protein